MENQEQQTQTTEIEKAEKRSYITMPEIIDMKGFRLTGMSYQKIADKLGRNIKTVIKSLELFDKILPDEPDLKHRVIDRIEEIAERHLQNAERICQAADSQVMRKIYLEETTAKDAAWIRKEYWGMMNKDLGLIKGDVLDEKEQSPKIVNFIQNIINIQDSQKNDRPKSTTRIEESDGGDVDGGEKACVEGVVS